MSMELNKTYSTSTREVVEPQVVLDCLPVMTATPMYSLGQEVYVVDDSRIVRGKIVDVRTKITYDNRIDNHEVRIDYRVIHVDPARANTSMNYLQSVYSVDENRLHTTKEGLVEQLLKA